VQRATPPHRLRGRDDQRPAQQPVAFLAAGARSEPAGRFYPRPLAWRTTRRIARDGSRETIGAG
jgi:hypothetical protein